MKNFDLETIDNSEYNFVIYSTSFETPFACIDEITEQLKQNDNRNFKVLFDLLLSIGNTSERFVEANFNGEILEKSTFKFVSLDKKNNLRIKSRDYYSNHLFLLENSVLNSAQIKLLSKGICI
ncbi:type II toxin-antitoxin system RnlB family antitoxin [Bacillus sp. RG28]|uniref:Type II toxin-antitoxin system RnlB family antitoxin n=1 Tax=Gottfriedia endophytica TaxID=2820819 RepID=A0A940NTF7_9BACI|nr:type II toxin-antitoxin system RnlB family antitoxin [Gottfriedia endophytica]MBP0726757.1 type II toxin-antitoxin system RnlB family antitoxin [Gottfriedia endophytica]